MPKNDFEGAIVRLEEIVKALENGNVALDESIKLYEEGLGLAKICTEKLETAKQKLTTIDEYLKVTEQNEQYN